MQQVWQPATPQAVNDTYTNAMTALKTRYLADGGLYIDPDGCPTFRDDEASETFYVEADQIDQVYKRARIVSQVWAVTDYTLLEHVVLQNSQGVLERLQYLSSRRNSVRASWVPSYRKSCEAAFGILLQVAMNEFVGQLFTNIQADPIAALQEVLDSSSETN